MIKNILLVLAINLCFSCELKESDEESLFQLEATNKAIRAAFAKGDVDEVMRYHHPDVSKVFHYDDPPNDYEGVRQGLIDLFENNEVSFGENKIESQIINGNTAILQTKFSLKGKVKGTGEEWEYSGRTMVISVRYDQSPTGWATIREIVQPAP